MPGGKTALATLSQSVTTLDSLAGVRLSFMAGGMIIGQSMTADQWTSVLTRMRQLQDAYHNNLADLIAYGRREFGTEFVDEKLEQMEFSLTDVARADAIGQLTLDLRTSHPLTSEHYFVLGRKFPADPKAQAKWAALAEEHQLSPLALKRSLDAEGGPRLITDKELSDLTGRHSGQPVLQGLHLEVQRWVQAQGGEEKLLKAPLPVRQAFIAEMRPIVAIYEHLLPTIEAA